MTRDLVDHAAPAGPATGSADPPASFLRANRVTLLATGAAIVLAVAVDAASPRGHGITSLWMLLFSLAPFAAATVAVAWLDLGWAHRLRLHLILPPLCFLVFFTFFVPYIFFLFARNDFEQYFDRLYYAQLIMVPFIILSLVLSVRLGGARRSTVVRLAAAMLLIQLSGIEDLAVMIIREVNLPGSQPIPAVWDWADHMRVRLGHYPTRNEAYVFIAINILAAVAVLAVPGRWFTPVRERLRTGVRPRRRRDGAAPGGADGPN